MGMRKRKRNLVVRSDMYMRKGREKREEGRRMEMTLCGWARDDGRCVGGPWCAAQRPPCSSHNCGLHGSCLNRTKHGRLWKRENRGSRSLCEKKQVGSSGSYVLLCWWGIVVVDAGDLRRSRE